MNLAIEDDRLAHLLMSGDNRAGYDDARRRLDRAALVLSSDASAALPWAQAALLTAADAPLPVKVRLPLWKSASEIPSVEVTKPPPVLTTPVLVIAIPFGLTR